MSVFGCTYDILNAFDSIVYSIGVLLVLGVFLVIWWVTLGGHCWCCVFHTVVVVVIICIMVKGFFVGCP